MKSTILFLTLLVFISCSSSKINSYDSVLLEMSADPRSEAIFATMAIQLKQNGGFDRVLALLTDLVEDGRKQLHDATKLWQATEARCDVSTMKFKERQDYYTNAKNHLSAHVDQVTAEQTYASSSVTFLDNAATTIAAYQTKRAAGQIEEETYLNGRIADAKAGVDATQVAIDLVKNWNTAKAPATSFLQAKLDIVAQSYLKVKEHKIVIPSTFVQLAASDDQVRQRLLEWLQSLKLTFLELQNKFEESHTKRVALWAKINTASGELAGIYATDSKSFKDAVTLYVEYVQTAQSSITLFTELSNDNIKLVTANENYCGVEKTNYSTAKTTIEDQLKLFKDVRNYFSNNYAKLSDFVKGKYGSTTA